MVTLREARVRRMLTVRRLADLAGVSPATIHLAERGQRVPFFGTMQKIAAALGLEALEIAEFAAAIEAIARGGRGGLTNSGRPSACGV